MGKEIIVIGAGPGGLGAAILLALSGLRVKVFERLPTVGGRTSTLHLDGFRFDVGPTFFLYPRILDEIMRAAGTSLENEVELLRLDPHYRICFGAGGRLDATADAADMERQIGLIEPRDAAGFHRFMVENRRKMNLSQPCLEQPFESWRDLCRLRLLRMLPLLHPFESVDTYLRRFFCDPRVRLAFGFQSKYLGMSPFQCPSLFSILSFLEYEHGVWHPVGGCGAVSEAMARVARRLGVEIRLNEAVQALSFSGRRATGVRTAAGPHAADAIVLNADFAHAMTHLVPDGLRRRWSDAKIARKKFSCSTFMLYLGVRGTFADLPHHTIHISEHYERNLEEIERLKCVPADPSFYIQNACVSDRTLAPEGQSAIYLLAPVPHQCAALDWGREKAAFRALLLKRAEAAGFAGLQSRILAERMVTPADWESGYALHRGATFNLSHCLGQMLHRRPHNRFEDIQGIYLVGGGTHPGSGLPVIFEGARITARLLCEDLQVAPGWAMPGETESAQNARVRSAAPQTAGAPFASGSMDGIDL